MDAQHAIIEEAAVEPVFGAMSGYSWEHDPKRLGFNMARYKFVAKMLEGKDAVLEVGCADAFFSRIVKQHVNKLVCVDKNYAYIGSAKRVRDPSRKRWFYHLNQWDIMEAPLTRFDAAYALDLYEHLEDEYTFLAHMAHSAPLVVIGCPSLESQAYASEISKAEHVNCPTKEHLKTAMKRHFKEVLMFGMNDETLHTGIMAAYLFAIGVNAI